MAVKYLAGDRIIGTAAERAALQELIQVNPITTVGNDTVIQFNEYSSAISGNECGTNANPSGSEGSAGAGSPNAEQGTFTFTPSGSYNIRYLVVGGGGGGGQPTNGGAGGAGGVLANSSYAVTNQAYTIQVGRGGKRGHKECGGNEESAAGSSSSITPASGSVITAGAGGAGANQGVNATDGTASNGSGGGAGRYGSAGSGVGTGGDGGTASSSAGAGGGGASQDGGNASGGSGGDGGDGVANDITGTSKYYAGGGAGKNNGYTIGGVGGLGAGGGSNWVTGDGTSASGNNSTKLFGYTDQDGGQGYGGGGSGGSNSSSAGNQGGWGGTGVIILRFASSNGYTLATVSGTTTPAAALTAKLPNGAIFEESDTGKHYMFDGTDTWNEM